MMARKRGQKIYKTERTKKHEIKSTKYERGEKILEREIILKTPKIVLKNFNP